MNVKHYVSHLSLLFIFITLLVVFSHRLSLETGILFAVGFFAQLIDGAIGLGFGMVSTTALLVFDMNPALLSNSVTFSIADKQSTPNGTHTKWTILCS